MAKGYGRRWKLHKPLDERMRELRHSWNAGMDESETTRPRPFWRRFALFVLAGTLYTGLALLGVFLVDFLVRFPMALAGTEWPDTRPLNVHSGNKASVTGSFWNSGTAPPLTGFHPSPLR